MASEDRVDFNNYFGQAVRRQRQALGLTQGDIGGHLGLTRASIANIEAGRQQCALHTAVLIAHFLRTPLLDLLPPEPTGDDPDDFLKQVPREHRDDVALVLRASLASFTEPART